MDSSIHFSSSSSFSREEANLTSAGVAVNPYLALGLLLTYSSLGLAAIIGAFVYHRGRLDTLKRTVIMSLSGRHRHIIGAQNVQIYLFMLLCMDALSFSAAMVLVAELASSCTTGYSCLGTYMVWFVLTWFEILFQLLCVLGCLVYLSMSQAQQPQQGGRLRTLLGMFSIFCTIFVILLLLVSHVAVYFLGATNIVLTLSIIAKYFMSPVSPSFPPVAQTVKKLITAAAMCTFFIVFFPCFVLVCLSMNANTFEESTKYEGVLGIVVFSTNCLLIIDGLVCFLILKLSAAEEEHLQQQEQWQQQPQQQQQL